MSWARLLASGAGTIAWRLSIEGWPDDFVSHRGMEGPVLPRNVRTVAQALSLTTSSGNLLPSPGSETWTPNLNATVTTGQADPAGGTAAVLIADNDAVSSRHANPASIAYTSGNDLRASLFVKKQASPLNFIQILLNYDSGAAFDSIVMKLDDGTAQARLGTVTEIAVTDLGSWLYVSFLAAGAAASAVEMEVFPAMGLASAYPSVSGTPTGSVTVYGARIADATADPDGANALRIDRPRLLGLISEGFKFSESVDMVRAKWEARGLRISVAASPEVTASFATVPSAVTYLADDVTTISATIDVLSTAGWPSSGYLHIDREAVVYTGTTATSFTGCGRGAWDTLAAYHYQSFGARLRSPEITNRPQILEGRRVRLYAYGAGDSKTGDGTLVWTGVASTDRVFDGTRWSFTADPIASVLNASLGSDLEDPSTIRGIYYSSGSPLVITIHELSGSSFGTTPLADVRFALSGFWETQEEFCADLTTFMQARMMAASSFTQTVRAEPDGARWRLSFTTAGTPHWMWFEVSSQVDGTPGGPRAASTGDTVSTVSASATYNVPLAPESSGQSLVPRTTFGSGISAALAAALPDADKQDVDPATHDPYRIYLADGAGVTSNTTSCMIDWQSTGRLPDESGQTPFIADVISVDTTTRSIRFARPFGVIGSDRVRRYACDGTELPEIRMGRNYGTGSLADFIGTLTGQTAQYLNTGAVPDLRAADFGSLAELEAAALDGGALTTSRGFTVFAEVKLSDVIENECKLLGVYPCSDSLGRITFRKLRLPSQSEVADRTITNARVIVDDQFLSYERNTLGVFNTFLLRTGYDPVEDEWTGTPIKVRDVQAFGLAPTARVVECTPYSTDPRAPILIDDVVRVASRVLGVFGGPYASLTIEVPLTMLNTLLGDVVSVTWRKVPNGGGTLGVTAKLGHCVSREFEPMAGKGLITILLTDQRVGGYAPSAKVTNIVDNGDDTYTLTLSADYLPAGTTAEDFFDFDYNVRVFEWNSTNTSNNAIGNVTAVSGNDVTVNLGAWTHAGATWVLGYDVSTNIIMAGQKRFVFLAGSDGDLDWSDETNVPPFTFA